ncbi:MAG: DUF4363 family protein [Ruminiclostridium sp.]
MGRMITCFIILTSLIAFAIYGYGCSTKNAERLIETADEILSATKENDTKKASELALEAENIWRGLSDGTVFVEDMDCDNEIAMSISRIRVYAENADDEISAECAVLKRLAELYINRQKPIWSNIF